MNLSVIPLITIGIRLSKTYKFRGHRYTHTPSDRSLIDSHRLIRHRLKAEGSSCSCSTIGNLVSDPSIDLTQIYILLHLKATATSASSNYSDICSPQQCHCTDITSHNSRVTVLTHSLCNKSEDRTQPYIHHYSLSFFSRVIFY